MTHLFLSIFAREVWQNNVGMVGVIKLRVRNQASLFFTSLFCSKNGPTIKCSSSSGGNLISHHGHLVWRLKIKPVD